MLYIDGIFWYSFLCSTVEQTVLWFLISGYHLIEPYNYSGRRGRKEPEVCTAASLKRLYVENRPYLVGGHSQHDQSSGKLSSSFAASRFTVDLQKLRCSQLDMSRSILSMPEKYNYMKETFRKRLAFGKLNIFDAFTIWSKMKLSYMDVSCLHLQCYCYPVIVLFSFCEFRRVIAHGGNRVTY